MRTVTLEEHYLVPELANRISQEQRDKLGFPKPPPGAGANNPFALLQEIGEIRLKDMEEGGVDQQILSVASTGAEFFDGEEGVSFARAYNDNLAAQISGRSARFLGFAHLPMRTPEAAAAELERTVSKLGFRGALINGMSAGLFLDDPRFEPLLTAAQTLDVPLYLHPAPPPLAVQSAYYQNLPGESGRVLANAMWGWHIEVAIHVLRLALSGTFDRHPKLKIIIGHMGEGLPFMMDRITNTAAAVTAHLERPVRQAIMDQVWITTSGFFTQPPFVAALMTFGIDRILYSVDYPFAQSKWGRAFLNTLSLSQADMAKLSHGNADRLLKLNGTG